MNSSVTFCTVLVKNVLFRGVTGGTITVLVFYHGKGLHGNYYRSITAVRIPRGNPRGKPCEKCSEKETSPNKQKKEETETKKNADDSGKKTKQNKRDNTREG